MFFGRKSTGILAREEMISPDSRSLVVDLPIKAWGRQGTTPRGITNPAP
jgi:hypothetical protein